MLDLFGITFTSSMMVYFIFRALQRDRSEPWFQTLKQKVKAGPGQARPWQRGVR